MLQKYNKRSYHLTGIWHYICKMMNSTLYVTCLIKICEFISSICYEKTGTNTSSQTSVKNNQICHLTGS